MVSPQPVMNGQVAPDGAGLVLENLRSGYLGEAVVRGVSLSVAPGTIIALFGPNGAGKTTTLKAAAGLLPVYSGTVRLFGEDVSKLETSDMVERGAVYLPQERAVFGALTVRDNLELGAARIRDRQVINDRRQRVTHLFPRLGERMGQLAGTMSGGEQRMLSMGIALMAGARVLMLDEPSLGLAPRIYQDLLETAGNLARQEGIALMVVEQQIGEVLEVADHVYVLRAGEIVLEEGGAAARERDDWWQFF